MHMTLNFHLLCCPPAEEFESGQHEPPPSDPTSPPTQLALQKSERLMEYLESFRVRRPSTCVLHTLISCLKVS